MSFESKISGAFLNKNLADLLELESSVLSQDQYSSLLRALRLYVQMDQQSDGYQLYAQAYEAIHSALQHPPKEASLLALLLGLATLFAANSEQEDDAKIFLTRLTHLLSEKLPPELKSFIHYARWRYFYSVHKYPEQLQALKEGTSLAQPGSHLWLLLQTCKIEGGLLRADDATAREGLNELKPYRHLHSFQGGTSYDLLEASCLKHEGNDEAALAVLEGIPADQYLRTIGHFLRTKLNILLTKTHLRRASETLEESKRFMVETSHGTLLFRRNFTSVDYEQFRAREAILQNQLDQARACLQNILHLTANCRPAWGRVTSRWLLFNIEMANRRSRAARLALQQIDPHAQFRFTEWGRLHLLEGNTEKAIEYFHKTFLSSGASSIKERLSFASEITPDTLSEILISFLKKLPSKSFKQKEVAAEITSYKTVLVGNSPSIQSIQTNIRKFAPLDTTILISGETGTGKEVVARLLHDSSPRAKELFIAINCGGMSDNLIESELFGYEKGAFTGATASHQGLLVSAGKGTVFLDEISSMSQHLQSALLRVLENQEVRPLGSNKSHKMHARIIAATNESLELMVEQKRFREDLFYRLAHLKIHLPPLRERREDIPLLVHYFLEKLFKDLRYEVGDDLLEHLRQQDWPGNVRQLRNVVEQLVYHCGDSEILNASLLKQILHPSITASSLTTPAPVPSPILTSSPNKVPEDISYRSHRQQKIIDLIRARSKITRREIVHELRCSPNTATYDLRGLQEKKLIRRVQSNTNSNSSYFIFSSPSI
jgi:transcriptional regulator with PAS, ATPase and Fis domain